MNARFRIMVPVLTPEPGFHTSGHVNVSSEEGLAAALQSRIPHLLPREILVPVNEDALTLLLRLTVERNLRVVRSREEEIEAQFVSPQGFSSAEIGMAVTDGETP